MKWDEVGRRAFLKSIAGTGLAAALGEFGGNLAKAAELPGEIPLRTLGGTGLRVSMIGLGGYHAGLPEKEEDSIALIHRALDLGINFFDNADCYQEGRSEERMGKALEGRRQGIYLMSKVDQRDARGARQQLEKSLRRLRTDYLDIWQFHAVARLQELDIIFGPGGAVEAAAQAKKEGKIRFLGLSGHFDPTVQLAAVKRYAFDTIQMPINVVDPHYRSFRKTVLDEAVARNLGVIAMKSLGFGNILSQGIARAAEALPWTWSQPISVLVSGCERREVLDYNVYLAKSFKPMPESEQVTLLERTKPRAGGEAEHYKIWTD
jgi:aryl-alcohol dehydrogenase-like predicted oxidoreductase